MFEVVIGLTRQDAIRSKKPVISDFLDPCRCYSPFPRFPPVRFSHFGGMVCELASF
jgi:hypothetical protein